MNWTKLLLYRFARFTWSTPLWILVFALSRGPNDNLTLNWESRIAATSSFRPKELFLERKRRVSMNSYAVKIFLFLLLRVSLTLVSWLKSWDFLLLHPSMMRWFLHCSVLPPPWPSKSENVVCLCLQWLMCIFLRQRIGSYFMHRKASSSGPEARGDSFQY